MQRREIMQMISISTAGIILGRNSMAAGDSAVSPPWKTAVGLNGFASGTSKYKKTYPIWEILDFAARSGFDGIELVEGWPAGGYPEGNEENRIAALKRLYDGFGLQIFSIQLGVAAAFSPDADERRNWLDLFRNRAVFAQKAGCDCIGMWPGGGLRGQSDNEAVSHLGNSFHQAAAIAEDLGILCAFEIEPPFVFNTEEHYKKILEASNHPNLKAIYDPSHYDLMNGSTGRPHEMLRRIGVENIGYVHFTDTDGTLRDGGTSKHLACGDGHIDVDASLQTLYKGGFQGWIMIDAWEIPDPYDACLKAKRAIDAENHPKR